MKAYDARLLELPRVSRERAKEIGQVAYWNDAACKNGHKGFRYTKSARCCQCVNEATKRYATKKYGHLHRPKLKEIDRLRDELALKKLEQLYTLP